MTIGMNLRYYADNFDQEENNRTLTLLETIQEETDIQVEIERITERHSVSYSGFNTVDENDRSEVYDRDSHRTRH